MRPGPKPRPILLRLAEQHSIDENGCWNWLGQLQPNGYGRIHYRGTMRLVHRVSYEAHGSVIPEGYEIMHSCDNRRCINPSHLRAGTHLQNMREIFAKRRHPQQRRTACLYGHPFDLQNTSYSKTPSGKKRVCKTCRKLRRLNTRKRLGEVQ